MKQITLLIQKHWILILSLIIFIPLLLRNPYSTRTLIPNLEPFPDAMFYTTTPRCFLNGQGWKMCRLNDSNTAGISPAVPPAYSISLLPGYLFNFDVRTFYFTNFLLALISLLILYKVSTNFFKNSYITGMVLFFYITNYFIYWFPTLAMAENLLNPIFLLSILILQQKISIKLSLLAGLVSVSFYATKFAFAPLAVTFPILYLFKILLSDTNFRTKIYTVASTIIPAGILMLQLVGIQQLLSVLNQLFNGALDSNSPTNVTSGSGYFSVSYFSKHFSEYSNGLLGKSQHFLWDNTPLTERWIALPGLLGLLISIKKFAQNYKNLIPNLWLILSAISQLIFMSTFYVVDIRYVFHFLPILLFGFGFFLEHLEHTVFKNKLNIIFFIILLTVIYLATNLVRLKSTVMVNLKYSETPWWYLTQQEMNMYFDKLEKGDKKPLLITLSAPFLVDNYTNNNYNPLPLNEQQDFNAAANDIWGTDNYSNLINLYKEKLLNGYDVYLTNYGVSAANHFKESYSNIEKNFELVQVQSGCYNLCNIYKLNLKK